MTNEVYDRLRKSIDGFLSAWRNGTRKRLGEKLPIVIIGDNSYSISEVDERDDEEGGHAVGQFLDVVEQELGREEVGRHHLAVGLAHYDLDDPCRLLGIARLAVGRLLGLAMLFARLMAGPG